MSHWLDVLFLRCFAVQLHRSPTPAIDTAFNGALTMTFLVVVGLPAGLLVGLLPLIIPAMPVPAGGGATLVVALCIAPAWIALSQRMSHFKSTPDRARDYASSSARRMTVTAWFAALLGIPVALGFITWLLTQHA